MPTSKTKELAKKLGLLKKRKAEKNAENGRKRRKGQILSYVIVIDFESTCWKDKKGAQEIIEFPAVLLDVHTGDVVDEFQQYVQPRHNPILSDFCKELTGISQTQVDNGVPLPTCLYLFEKWVRQMKEQRGVCLMEPGKHYNSHDVNLCALATWSDWDLGVCLQYECRRKQIRKPLYFDQWIDLRTLYKQFYDRKPSGLRGSLEDLGIPFTGREHCGLDDARNTAKLCHRLVKDGCRLSITKSQWKEKLTSVVIAPELGKDRGLCTTQSTVLAQTHTMTPPSTLHSSATDNRKDIVRQEERKVMVEGVKAESTVAQNLHSGRNGVPEEEWNDEKFLTEIICEIEQFEKDYSESCVISRSTDQEPCDSRYSSRPHVPDSKTSTTGQEKHTESDVITPSRPRFVSHITPVTLLTPHHTHKPSSQSESNAHLPLQTLPLPKVPSHKPPSACPALQQQQTSPAQGTETTSCSAPQSPNVATRNVEPVKGTSICFQTPSTTQWMKVKRSSSSISPSVLSCDFLQPFNGGKITPPLCACGKRAKRKLVTSPGPNQGKPFFSCPRGRESGCQYFKWEGLSPNGTTCSVNLSSEYV